MSHVINKICIILIFVICSCDYGLYSKKSIINEYYIAEVPSHSGKTLIYYIENSSGYQVLVHDVRRIWANNEIILLEGYEFQSQSIKYYVVNVGYAKTPQQIKVVSKDEFEKFKTDYQFNFVDTY